jgi:hypothetical protein
MHVYTVHVPPFSHKDRDPILIKEGFNWAAFLFSAVWTLYRRLWLATAGIVVAVAVALALMGAFGIEPPVEAVVLAAIAFLVGAHGNDWYRRKLVKRGFREEGVVAAPNADAALRRFLDSEPERVQARTRVGPPPQPPLMPLAGV